MALLLAFAATGCALGDHGALVALAAQSARSRRGDQSGGRGLTKLKLPGGPEMSQLRPAVASSLADWMFCLRSDADDIPRNYALFVADNEIISYASPSWSTPASASRYEPVAERLR